MATVEQPFRSELYSVDLLQRHARQLAQQHRVGAWSGANPLLPRLAANGKLLRDYNETTLRVEKNRRVTPAADWLLDNFYLIDQQIHMARRHLPRAFSRELPHLTNGPCAGFPRVYDLARELISHVDGRIDSWHLTSFIAAYQEVTPLKLGELWAIPIMLRLGLIENLRRVAVLLNTDRVDRDRANFWADRMHEVSDTEPSRLIIAVGELAKSTPKITYAFVTEFWQRMQEKAPRAKLVLHWLEERLGEEGLTIEQMLQNESQNQAANQVSVGNSITSLRFLDAMDWREFVETLSVVEQTLRSDPADVYNDMDFATRDAYRHVVERIAKQSSKTEGEVATLAIDLARKKAGGNKERESHVGYYLLDQGIDELAREAGQKTSFRYSTARLGRAYSLPLYLGGFSAITIGLTLVCLPKTGLQTATLIGLAALILLSASQLGVALVNWIVPLLVKPRLLPRMDFSEGIPPEARAMVVVPTMLTSVDGVANLLESLEVRYLGNRDSNIYFALLTDFRDAPQEHMPEDEELVKTASQGIEMLNQRYPRPSAPAFYLFHRPRLWNEKEGVWMGYERKRGKLADFNALLRGRRYERFSKIVGDLKALPFVKYVITLDTDTQLPRDAARQLVGTMAHPLNLPIYDPKLGRVREGYAIMQPRVGVNLASATRSQFANLFSGEPGIDPYTRTVSDVYQDAFQEGSFIGKGIYDIDVFEKSVGTRFPENRILSHDLLESSYARSALVTDVELYEDFPAFYLTDAQRRHRWMRGDWQIARWLLPWVPGADDVRLSNPLSALSRWKLFDNLRRSLIPIALLTLLVLGWTVFATEALVWTALTIAIVVLPALVSLATDLVSKSAELPWIIHARNVGRAGLNSLGQAIFTLVFLPYDAAISLDAILRTLGRLFFTHRHLLEWQTASEVERRTGSDLPHLWRRLWFGPAAAVVTALAIVNWHPTSAWVASPVLTLWLFSPFAAWYLSKPPRKKSVALTEQQTRFLRSSARKTWRYFETFVGPEDCWLPPDNFQEFPHPIIATRTSPTNIGLAMLSSLAAWDFGYLSMRQLTERLDLALRTLERLERYHGHFYNWYDTRTLQPLNPPYLSTVDNGNFAGFLMTLRSGLAELAEKPWPTNAVFIGLRDTLAALLQTLQKSDAPAPGKLLAGLEALEKRLAAPSLSLAAGYQLLENAQQIAAGMPTALDDKVAPEYSWWRRAFEQECREHLEDFETAFCWLKLNADFEKLQTSGDASAQPLVQLWQRLLANASPKEIEAEIARLNGSLENSRHAPLASQLKEAIYATTSEARRRALTLENLARRCDDCAEMDFSLLYDSSRKLFSIGYNVATHQLDGSYYDLLASEARLASFVAIAMGQLPQEHWFALGRLVTTVDGKPALISWSGSMFEYLMPLLVMPSHPHTLLDASYESSVARQIEYGEHLGVPWGVSESGYNLTDAQSNYQYRSFGVPGLGLKRGLADDVVIAPYATSMALMVAPKESCLNLERLRALGAEGSYGFYEALDYTPTRLPRGKDHVLIQSFMAHHQGMAFLGLAYHLLNRPMQRRFNANPLLRSAELLLQERVPKETSVLYPHELETERKRATDGPLEATYRVFTNPHTAAPEVHLLSNGRYHVMVTNAGGGYSLWNEVALTRWREDATCDCWGSFIYLRDVATGNFWSTAYQPVLQPTDVYEAIFSQGRAEYRSRSNNIDAHTEIAVSPEDDVEVRRVTLVNRSNETREIEVTSFAEVALNTAGADLAHPAFTKLFIQTEILRPVNAIICSRRPRTRGEKPPWLFHLMLVRGSTTKETSYETDRSKFIGRGRNAATPAAFSTSGPLSNSEGSVLDPSLSIRRTIRIPPNESARVFFVTGSSASREGLMHLIEKYQDQSIADRVFELAWTHGLVTLRHLNATEPQAQLFGRLAGALLFNQPARRASGSILAQNRRGQRSLWSYGISGDLPIVLVRSTRADRIELVREILQAHAYWRLKGLTVDLIIVNEDNSVYRQSVHDQIMSLIASGIEAQMLDKPGGIFVRRADQLSSDDYLLLQATARIVFSDESGTLNEQLQRRTRPETPVPPLVPRRIRRLPAKSPELPARDLLFFNGLGGFTPDGREYVITLQPDQTTPAPWVNVIANAEFGTLISESGAAYTWAENCHEFRLTPWSNDPVTDTTGEAFYIRDEESGRFWSPTPMPARGQTPYVVRHGFGYTVFEHTEDDIESEMWVYVAADASVKFVRFILRDLSGRERNLSVTGYWEWVLGEVRQRNALHVVTELEPKSGAILARNAYNSDFEGRTAFAVAGESARSYTCDRGEFIGRNGTLANPAAMKQQKLSGKVGAGLDPCTALQVNITLGANEQREVIFKMGAAVNRDKALNLLQVYRREDACHDAIYLVRAHWNDALGAVQVETPDPALNLLANGWLLYQTMSCRIWARTGFYQSGGAFGFRDQLQDTMALIHARPTLLREHLLRAAAHQFPEGDVQHWWHPPTDRGVRTHFSDDYLWLPYALCRYVETIGDTGVMEEKVRFIEGRPLRPEEESYFDTPRQSEESATLYEHCVRSIRYGLKFGEHGLPLIGCGDWNDGMNLIGEHGKGESVWLAFFLADVLKHFGALARSHGDAAFADYCHEQYLQLQVNIEKHAWDGEWYRRAYFDNGTPLGSASNEECQIDSLPQSWSALTGVGDSERTHSAMSAVARRLVRPDKELIQLFDPPFDKSALEPGYIKGYVPGVRENGGQYTHGAIWTVMAFAALGEIDRAWDLFRLINPIRHGETPAAIARYKLEPYVIAADVYGMGAHAGRGGWSWYTGSAGWLYRLITESLLGLSLEVDKLRFTPRLPDTWNSFTLQYRYRETHYHITLTNVSGKWSNPPSQILDGVKQSAPEVGLNDDQKHHHVELNF